MGMGDTQLSDMKATYYPPSIQPGFMGAHPPVKNGYGSLSESAHISYFQNYRNENLSKMQVQKLNSIFLGLKLLTVICLDAAVRMGYDEHAIQSQT